MSLPLLDRLRYRRQFVLGPQFIDGFPEWTRMEIGGGSHLSVHPDLEVTRAVDAGRSVTMLGYVLDPNDPEATNESIVHALLASVGGARQCIERTHDLAGRWILIVNDGRDTIVFHDAAGLRKVCFTHGKAAPDIMCASQPGPIADALGLERDPDALAFMTSRADDEQGVYWMPGDTTMYREIQALLPNHYLDLGTGTAHRYWPTPSLDPSTALSAPTLAECARLLRGQLAAARQRFPRFAIAMTAGWDSRLMLALAHDVAPDSYCFTLTYPNDRPDATDIAVPRTLLGKLGLTHHLVPYPSVIDEEFKQVVRRNTDAVKDAYSADLQGLFQCYPPDAVCITGDVAEIVKCYYRLPEDDGRKVTGLDMARISGIGEFPFAIRAFDRWLASAEAGNLHLLDLFCWEQMAGRWQAMIRRENDIVHESLAPLNCRHLLTPMLALPESQRRPPEHDFLRRLISELWNDVLSVPINPPEPLRAREMVRLVLQKLRLYDLLRNGMRRLRPGRADRTASSAAKGSVQ